MKIFQILGRLFIYGIQFTYELLVANLQIAYLVLKPNLNFKSAAITYKSNMKTIPEMIMICNSITLTPGTMVMDANLDTQEIKVHAMSVESAEQIKKDLCRFPENQVLAALRGPE